MYKKTVFLSTLLVVSLLFSIISFGNTSIVNQDNVVKAIVNEYIKNNYDSIKNSKVSNFDGLIKDETFKKYITLEKKYMIGLYKKTDKSLTDYNYKIIFNNLDFTDNQCIVDLNLDIYFTYKRNDIIDKTDNNIRYYLLLEKTDGKWYVKQDVNDPVFTADKNDIYDKNYTSDMLKCLKKVYKSIDDKALEINKCNKLIMLTTTPSTEDITPRYIIVNGATRAVEYARKWAYSQNPAYPFWDDEDCTNFVSQCLVAGHISMEKPSWYCKSKSDYSTSWIRVGEFYDYLTDSKNFDSKIFSKAHTSIDKIHSYTSTGDVIQFYNVKKMRYSHSVISSGKKNGKVIYCGHSNPRKDADLVKAYDSSWYYTALRVVKVLYPDED